MLEAREALHANEVIPLTPELETISPAIAIYLEAFAREPWHDRTFLGESNVAWIWKDADLTLQLLTVLSRECETLKTSTNQETGLQEVLLDSSILASHIKELINSDILIGPEKEQAQQILEAVTSNGQEYTKLSFTYPLSHIIDTYTLAYTNPDHCLLITYIDDTGAIHTHRLSKENFPKIPANVVNIVSIARFSLYRHNSTQSVLQEISDYLPLDEIEDTRDFLHHTLEEGSLVLYMGEVAKVNKFRYVVPGTTNRATRLIPKELFGGLVQALSKLPTIVYLTTTGTATAEGYEQLKKNRLAGGSTGPILRLLYTQEETITFTDKYNNTYILHILKERKVPDAIKRLFKIS